MTANREAGEWKPKFGDPVINTNASDDNPTRHGFFVRALRRTGRMNPGVWWECITPDYKPNETWLHKPEGMIPGPATTHLTRCKPSYHPAFSAVNLREPRG